jgi:hypothetical protein
MAEELDPQELVSSEELLMSEVIQSEAMINLLDRKGIVSKRHHNTKARREIGRAAGFPFFLSSL